MAILEITEVPNLLKRGEAIAGLDLGTKTIGLAVSDLGLSMANPRPVLKRIKFGKDIELLKDFYEREKIGVAIIGLPLNMNGTEGPRAQATRGFVRNAMQHTDIPFVYWDERLSTVAATRALLEMDVSRKSRAERIDSAAASFILQGALDRLRSLRN